MIHVRNSSDDGIFFLESDGTPSGILTAFNEDIIDGSLCIDKSNQDLYILKSGVWTLVGDGTNGDIDIIYNDYTTAGLVNNIEFSNSTSGINNRLDILENQSILDHTTAGYLTEYNDYTTAGLVNNIEFSNSTSGIHTRIDNLYKSNIIEVNTIQEFLEALERPLYNGASDKIIFITKILPPFTPSVDLPSGITNMIGNCIIRSESFTQFNINNSVDTPNNFKWEINGGTISFMCDVEIGFDRKIEFEGSAQKRFLRFVRSFGPPIVNGLLNINFNNGLGQIEHHRSIENSAFSITGNYKILPWHSTYNNGLIPYFRPFVDGLELEATYSYDISNNSDINVSIKDNTYFSETNYVGTNIHLYRNDINTTNKITITSNFSNDVYNFDSDMTSMTLMWSDKNNTWDIINTSYKNNSNSVSASSVDGTNGLTTNGNNIELGGSLNKNTIIDLNSNEFQYQNGSDNVSYIKDETILDLDSTDKVLKLPIINDTDNIINSPLEGMFTYDSSVKNLRSYDGVAWLTYFGIDINKVATNLYFVHPNGDSDGQVGIMTKPFDYITAVNLCNTGDTIIFIEGDYGDISTNIAVGGVSYRTMGKVNINFIDGGSWDYESNPGTTNIIGDFEITVNKTWDGSTNNIGAINIYENANTNTHIVENVNINIITGSHAISYRFINSGSTLKIKAILESTDGYLLKSRGNSGNYLYTEIIGTYTGTRDIQPVEYQIGVGGYTNLVLNSNFGGIYTTGNTKIFGDINLTNGRSIILGSNSAERVVNASFNGGGISISGNLSKFVNFLEPIKNVSIIPSSLASKYRFKSEIMNIELNGSGYTFDFNDNWGSGITSNANGTIMFNNSVITDVNLDSSVFSVKIYDSEITLTDNTQWENNISRFIDIKNSKLIGNNTNNIDESGSTVVLYDGGNAPSSGRYLRIENSEIINNSTNNFSNALYCNHSRPHVTRLKESTFYSGGDNAIILINGGQGGTIEVIGNITMNNGYSLNTNSPNWNWKYGNENNFKTLNTALNSETIVDINNNNTPSINNSGYIFKVLDTVSDTTITLEDTLPIGWNATYVKYNDSSKNILFVTNGTNTILDKDFISTSYTYTKIIKISETEFILEKENNNNPFIQTNTVGTFAWDSREPNKSITLTGNTILDITNTKNGSMGYLIVKQDATGGRTITLPTNSKVVNGGNGGIILTSAPNSIDILQYWKDDTDFYWSYGVNLT